MLIIILGMLLVPTLGWRWMIRLSVAPSLILIFLFKVCLLPSSLFQLLSLELTRPCVPLSVCPPQFIPESARYNVSAGNVPAAVETLQKIAAMNRSSLPAGHLVEPILVSSSWSPSSFLSSRRFIGFICCFVADDSLIFCCCSDECLSWCVKVEVEKCFQFSIFCCFQRERGNWRVLLGSSFRRTSVLLWYSW